MNQRKAGAALTLALGVLVGCQGGDASEPIDAASTVYAAGDTYGGDDDHPILASTEDAIVRAAENDLETIVNAHRIAKGWDALQIMPELKELALAHAIHMGRHEPAFFDHRNPEGERPEERIRKFIVCAATGENIAAGQSAAEAVFRSWLDSPGHRANLEDPKWTHMGAGHAVLPESPYVTYWTLDFVERR